MPTFKYTAKKGPKEITRGEVEAAHQQMAVHKIIQLGLTPIEVSPHAAASKSPASAPRKTRAVTFFKRVRRRDVVLLTRQMSDLTEASVPLLRTLQIVSRQTKNPFLKERLTKIYDAVRNGGSLSQALDQHADIFSPLYVNMVKIGEVGGHLDKVLDRLAEFLEKEEASHQKITASLAYPLMILGVGVLTIFVLLSFVIPRISILFDDLGQSLPLATRLLMGISGFFSQYWWLLLALVIVTERYWRRWARSAKGRQQVDQWKLGIPFFGGFIKGVETGRFARTLGTLMENGVTITVALRSVGAVVDNTILRGEIQRMAQEVTQGASLKDVLRPGTFFPDMAVDMMVIGEETGRLDQGLYKIADTFERQTEQQMKMMMSLLGPMVLIGVVLIVGFVVIAMLLPVFQMNLLVQ